MLSCHVCYCLSEAERRAYTARSRAARLFWGECLGAPDRYAVHARSAIAAAQLVTHGGSRLAYRLF
jgi:hypothetical protein